MLRYQVNRFETGVTSGSRGSETNDRKKKYIYILYLFKIFTFICKKIEAIKLSLRWKKKFLRKRLEIGYYTLNMLKKGKFFLGPEQTRSFEELRRALCQNRFYNTTT